MNALIQKVSLTVLWFGVVAWSGCGGGGSSKVSMNVTGNWEIGLVGTTSSITINGGLQQNGAAVSGLLGGVDPTCVTKPVFHSAATDLSFSGTLSGSNLVLTAQPLNGQVLTLTLTGVNDSQFAGTFSIAGGCADGVTGKVSAFKIPSLSGTWTGTLQTETGSPLAVNAAIQQSSSTDQFGQFPLSGTFTFSGSSCATTRLDGFSNVHGRSLGGGIIEGPADAPTTNISFAGATDLDARTMSFDSSVLKGACGFVRATGTLTHQ